MRRKLHEALKLATSVFTKRIQAGPLQGCRWIIASGSSFIRGRYEPAKTAAIKRLVSKGDVVFDIGAHVGYYTVLMSRLVGETGQIVAFEPRGINQRFLKKHLSLNRCMNVRVIEAAVSNRAGSARMDTSGGTGTGHLSDEGRVKVKVVTIDESVESQELPEPTFLKIDVEGGELRVLEGGRRTISRLKPKIILATHDEELDRRCIEFLENLGYSITEIVQPKGDRELVALPPKKGPAPPKTHINE